MTFKDEKKLQIHRFVHAKLSGQHAHGIVGWPPVRAFPMPPTYLNVSLRAGHILVHYLYTGEIKLPSCLTAATAAPRDAAGGPGAPVPVPAGEPFPAIGVLLELAISLDSFPALKGVVVGAQGVLDNLALEQPAVAVLTGVRRVLLGSDLGHRRKPWLAEYVGRIVERFSPEELRDLYDTLTDDRGVANPTQRLLMRAVLMRVSSGLPPAVPLSPAPVQRCPYPAAETIRRKVDKLSEVAKLALESFDRILDTGDKNTGCMDIRDLGLLAGTVIYTRELLPDVAELLSVVDERGLAEERFHDAKSCLQ